jgi:hypothetical protein
MQTVPLAILNAAGQVVTFVRPDVPPLWGPPPGCTAMPADQLPSGWQYAPDDSPVPETISARQARLWLIRHGVTLATVDQTIAAITDAMTRESVRVEWEYGTEVHRDSPFVAQLSAELGLTSERLDAAFREAAQI